MNLHHIPNEFALKIKSISINNRVFINKNV